MIELTDNPEEAEDINHLYCPECNKEIQPFRLCYGRSGKCCEHGTVYGMYRRKLEETKT